MELKVVCDCGQKFKFDVEPVNGQMPFKMNCPVCNADATRAANAAISQKLAMAPGVGSPMITPLPGMAPIVEIPSRRSDTVFVQKPAAAAVPPKTVGEFNLGLGILGAVLGAAVGGGFMYCFFLLANFRFPLLGTCIGLLTGFAARYLYKGRGSTMGAISAAIAVISTSGTLFLIYGELQAVYFISIGVSGYLAYRLVS
jgi:hypothetical protein